MFKSKITTFNKEADITRTCLLTKRLHIDLEEYMFKRELKMYVEKRVMRLFASREIELGLAYRHIKNIESQLVLARASQDFCRQRYEDALAHLHSL